MSEIFLIIKVKGKDTVLKKSFTVNTPFSVDLTDPIICKYRNETVREFGDIRIEDVEITIKMAG